MTGNELQALDSFIVSRLAADSALVALIGANRIFQELAPESTAPPFVVFTFLSSPDTITVGATGRIMTRPLYLIESLTRENSYAQAAPIAARIDAALLGASGQVPSANLAILGTTREELIRRAEIDTSGVRYSRLGGRYRFILSAIS